MSTADGKYHREALKDVTEGIKKPQIARLVRRAAIPEVRYLNRLIYVELRAVLIYAILEPVIRGSITITKYLKVKTVTDSHVRLWLALNGTYDANAFEKGKKTFDTFTFSKKRDKAKTKEIKTSLGKSIFSRFPFQRLCRAIASDLYLNRRFSKNALEALQFYAEAELGEVIRAASLVAWASNRATLYPKDIQTGRRISHQAERGIVGAGPSNINLASYIYKVLKKEHPDTGASSLAIQSIQNLLNSLFSRIMAAASALLRAGKKSTLDSRALEAAALLVIPHQLGKYADSEGRKAAVKFAQGGGTARAANILFPVTRITNKARQFSSAKRISRKGSVYLAAVLEFICSDIFYIIKERFRREESTRITTKHVHMIIEDGEDFSLLFHNVLLGTFLLGAPQQFGR